ncbi:ubiquitin-conjugating enzyme E2 4 [Drosophila mojavensis]|uniref:UBC core domain-containing protein n=1 Tax=Drosophila mojavensis TaxID=7230 RepID=B4KYB5_DROMO|nr:ubiquitin-conjugating enzyme E2 4 [Drosophila mojavensis]EDW17694.1 uncharacterized protein Dmoj_GI12815 [Drosophila mojavensis]
MLRCGPQLDSDDDMLGADFSDFEDGDDSDFDDIGMHDFPFLVNSPEETMRRLRIYARYPNNGMPETRLKHELAQIRQGPVEGCRVDVLDDNLFEWAASLKGPVNTPYEGGVFDIHISFPNEYPFEPPTLKFVTKIYHCNVYGSLVCTERWTPVITVAKLMVSILYMMATPDPMDPLNPAIAKLYISHRSEHDKIARQWTRRFAMPNSEKDGQ